MRHTAVNTEQDKRDSSAFPWGSQHLGRVKTPKSIAGANLPTMTTGNHALAQENQPNLSPALPVTGGGGLLRTLHPLLGQMTSERRGFKARVGMKLLRLMQTHMPTDAESNRKQGITLTAHIDYIR